MKEEERIELQLGLSNNCSTNSTGNSASIRSNAASPSACSSMASPASVTAASRFPQHTSVSEPLEVQFQHEPPMQLELLPLCPSRHQSAAAGVASAVMAWQQQQQKENQELQRRFAVRRIDMNQVPPYPEPEVRGDASPSSGMTLSSLALKRDGASLACDSSPRASDEEADGGSGTRKKLRLSKEQSALLEESFKQHPTLNPKQKSVLAKQLSLTPRQVEVWFQNRRARTKLKQTEVDCELLKRCYESLMEENRRLQKELQELRAIKMVSPPYAHDRSMPVPAAAMLTICPSCERVAGASASATGRMGGATAVLATNISQHGHHAQAITQSSTAC